MGGRGDRPIGGVLASAVLLRALARWRVPAGARWRSGVCGFGGRADLRFRTAGRASGRERERRRLGKDRPRSW